MKLIKTMVVTAAVMASITAQAQDVNRVHVYGVSVNKNSEPDNVGVSFTIEPSKWRLGRNNTVTVTPVIISADGRDSVAMEAFTVSGKNAWYQSVRDGKPDGELPLRSGSGAAVRYADSVGHRGWMDNSRLNFVTVASCYCDGDVPKEPETIRVAEMDWRKKTYNPDFVFITPEVDTVKMFSLSGRGYVNFRLNRTDIDVRYLNNDVELQKIVNSVRGVCTNSDATLKSITLTGYASPEGPYANNDRLAKGRTKAIVDYIRTLCDIPSGVMSMSWVAENWGGLRDSVEARGDMPEREAILRLIDSNLAPDAKDHRIKKDFPEEYAELLRNVYPWLRITEYEITYNVRKYTDVDEIRMMMKQNPGNLSLNELFIGAMSYPKGSAEYNAAFELAATMYPQSEVANLNAANAAMASGNLTKAEEYLQRAGNTAEAAYARGILKGLKGDISGAREWMETISDKGLEAVSTATGALRAIENDKGQVRFMDPSTEE